MRPEIKEILSLLKQTNISDKTLNGFTRTGEELSEQNDAAAIEFFMNGMMRFLEKHNQQVASVAEVHKVA